MAISRKKQLKKRRKMDEPHKQERIGRGYANIVAFWKLIGVDINAG